MIASLISQHKLIFVCYIYELTLAKFIVLSKNKPVCKISYTSTDTVLNNETCVIRCNKEITIKHHRKKKQQHWEGAPGVVSTRFDDGSSSKYDFKTKLSTLSYFFLHFNLLFVHINEKHASIQKKLLVTSEQ